MSTTAISGAVWRFGVDDAAGLRAALRAAGLTSMRDDETVVVTRTEMERRISVEEYLAGEQTNRPQELAYGFLREPPSPDFGHQTAVGRLSLRLTLHVRRQQIGQVVVSPMDVVLDRDRALVVQPDILFISADRLGICGRVVEGAPDLVVEVLSTSNRRHDRDTKVGWYRQYGVRECWVADPIPQTIEVLDFSNPGAESRLFAGDDPVVSRVLPKLSLLARQAFFD